MQEVSFGKSYLLDERSMNDASCAEVWSLKCGPGSSSDREIMRSAVFGELTIFVMERKIFWTAFILLGLIADFLLPFWWACAATIPILFVSWWVAYRSDWF